MKANYRSSPSIISFINAAFSKIMGDEPEILVADRRYGFISMFLPSILHLMDTKCAKRFYARPSIFPI